MVICGVPLFRTTPVTTPVAEFCESIWTVTVLPTRLFACIMASDEVDWVVCCNVVNCAIWAAISVSDCGFMGSWYWIWATSSLRKSVWFNTLLGLVTESGAAVAGSVDEAAADGAVANELGVCALVVTVETFIKFD